MKQKNLLLTFGILGLCACSQNGSSNAGTAGSPAHFKHGSSCTSIECKPGVIFVNNSDAAALLKASTDLEAQRQQTDQFSNNHYAVLVAPGVYNMVQDGQPRAFNLGYYTQVLGVGKSMEDVTINPGVEVYNQGGNPDCFKDKSNPACKTLGGLDNFWRGIENFSIQNNASNALIYSVSQASPIRSIHFKGSDVLLCDYHTYQDECGYASGGFMANSIVDQALLPGSQQQWFSRNSRYNNTNADKHEVAAWNSVFVGTTTTISPTQIQNPFPFDFNQPVNNVWNNFPVAYIPNTAVSKEKPYLTCTDTCNNPEGGIVWKVEVPQVRTNSTGTDTTIPTELDVNLQFTILSPDNGTTDPSGVTTLDKVAITNLNAALDSGKSLLITPGVYNLDGGVINITQNNTIVLGLGIPSLICTNPTGCINVSATAGVDLSGFILEAGYNLTPSLLQIGNKDSSGSQKNPIFLHDVYFRIAETQSNTGLVRQTAAAAIIYTSYVVGDNLWMWRADHDKSSDVVNWNQDRARYGLIVYGNNVTMNGLSVEHFQDYQTIWYGENGLVNFYQSEMPYDVPGLAQWTCTDPRTGIQAPAGNGCASYVIGDGVQNHTANGLGVYTYFPDKAVMARSAFLVPTNLSNGIMLNNLMGKWLNGDPASGYKNLVATANGSKCWGYGVESTPVSSKDAYSVLGTVNSTAATMPCN
jgi:hypothetical protein